MSVTTQRIAQLEREIEHFREINAELLAACEKSLAWFKSESAFDMIRSLKTATAKAKGGQRVDP